MTGARHDRSLKRKSYHHGNLKAALVDAARELIAEKGPAGFSFAEAARHAGVSAAAPYRHYRDREELIADVARQGFELFEAALRTAWDEGRPTPRAAFERLGRTYLAFARNETAYYTAMFESGLSFDPASEPARAGERAFAVLREATSALVAELDERHRPPVTMMALHIWSITHGIASLFGRGDAGRQKTPISPEELLESAFLIYLQGLQTNGDANLPAS